MKGFVFDLDNTLYDRYATLAKIMENGYDKAKKYINPSYDLESAIDHLCRTESLYLCNGWQALYSALITEHFFNPSNIPDFEKAGSFIWNGFKEVAVNHPFTVDVLTKLSEKGYKLAVLTNHSDFNLQKRKLELLGIGHFFETVVISGELSLKMSGHVNDSKYYKPNTAIFEYTANLLGIDPSELYYVGDNPNADVKGAINSGYTPVWITSRSPWTLWGTDLPQHRFKTIEGLLTLI